jgi:hypothetical protein
MKTSHALALVSAIILAFCAMPAKAQPYNRTFVSGLGSNTSTCGTRTLPCAGFQNALGNTNPGGEIDCLDAGDFGPVTIAQSVSIICDGVSNAGIISTGNFAIYSSAQNGDVVYLSGLDLEGMGIGLFGVYVNSGSTVYIVHSTIRGFLGTGGGGVSVQSITNPTRVVIKDSIIVNNSDGLYVQAPTVEGQGTASNAAIVINSVIDGSKNYTAVAGGPSTIALTESLLTGNPVALDLELGSSPASAVFIGPSNTIAGGVYGTTTSVPFE